MILDPTLDVYIPQNRLIVFSVVKGQEDSTVTPGDLCMPIDVPTCSKISLVLVQQYSVLSLSTCQS
jgi:hypothetical protein